MSVERRTDSRGRPKHVVRWREGGKQRARVFDTKRDATVWDAETRRRRRMGELGLLDGGKRTVAELHQAWWEAHAPDLARASREATELAWRVHIEPRLGKLRLSELTPLAVEQFARSLLLSGVGEGSVERCWVVLSSMLGRAEAWEWVARNPVRAAKKPKKKNARRVPRVLAPADVEAIRAQLGQRDAAMVSVLALAGLRPGECLALRWSDVGAERISVSRSVSFGETKGTKTGRSRSVTMIGPLRSELLQWRFACGGAPGDALVFPGPTGDPWDDGMYRRWRRFTFKPALDAAGIDNDVRVYDLRHHRASMLVKSGMNIVEAAAQMGHSPAVLLSTYAHVLETMGHGEIDIEDEVRKARSEAAPIARTPLVPYAGI